MSLHVSDHALLRFMQRAGGIDVEELRAAVAASLERAGAAAEAIGACDYSIRADGLVYCIRAGVVVTVLHDRPMPRGVDRGRS